jgi:hypothetical protein
VSRLRETRSFFQKIYIVKVEEADLGRIALHFMQNELELILFVISSACGQSGIQRAQLALHLYCSAVITVIVRGGTLQSGGIIR